MAALAGFDVIGELHKETIVDLINLAPFPKPDGSVVYLLGGPFSIDLTVDLGTLGFLTLRVILDITLHAVIHQPLAHLDIALTGGSASVAGRSLSHIGGQATVFVPLGFAPPPGAPSNKQVPVLLLGAVTPNVVLDAASRSLADGTLGKGGADRLTSGLSGALAALLAAIGNQSIGAISFSVVPGIDSHDPTQLSATPTVAWIDQNTLGVFGYYRAAASGGDVRAKVTGDLDQTREEFFYGQPGAVSVLPGRRVALLLSAGAFKQVVACPAVRNQIVKALVHQRELPSWIVKIRNRDAAALLQQVTAANFLNYYLDEIRKDPNGDPAGYLNHVNARLQVDAEAAIAARAAQEEDAWLDTPEGQQMLTDATPPPCGNGAVEITRQHVSFAQSDFVPMLRRLDVHLDQDRITVDFACDGSLELLPGDVGFSVSGTMDIFVTVTDLGTVEASFDVHPAVVNGGATGLTGDFLAFLKFFFGAPTWHALLSYLGLVLQSKLQSALTTVILPVPLPQLFPTRMADVKIDAQSILALGLVCRRPRWNEFNPGLILDTTINRIPADQPALHGRILMPATEWGCRPAHFETTRTFWDTTIGVSARLRDAPLPITVLGWQVEIGNFSFGVAHSIDPRPTWSNEPAAIAAGRLTLGGNVNHPDPPVDGGLQHREDLPADVTGDPNQGWQLRFSGVDGNFYVRLSADVRDGEGRDWHGESFVTVQGDQLELSPLYTQYKADCDAKYKLWFQLKLAAMGRLAAVAQVQPGQPVMSGETREAIAIQTLVLTGDPAALNQLIAAAEQFGPGVFRQVGRVAPAALVPLRGAGRQLR